MELYACYLYFDENQPIESMRDGDHHEFSDSLSQYQYAFAIYRVGVLISLILGLLSHRV